MHHTKFKGDLGVLKAQIDLHLKGYIVCVPQTKHAPFDLVACNQDKIYRIQVKYREAKNGVLSIPFRSVWSDKNGIHTNPINKNAIDLFCVYCLQTDKCYYFDPKIFSQSVVLRVDTPKNNQTKNIKFASDYEQVP